MATATARKSKRDKQQEDDSISVVRVPDRGTNGSLTADPSSSVSVASPGLPRTPGTDDGQPPRAGHYVRGAVKVAARIAATPGDSLNASDQRVAETWLDHAFADLPSEMADVGVGSELIPLGDGGNAAVMRHTVESPTYVTADASRTRTDLAFQAGALEMGLDVAETIQASNSLEKMLAHQLAATHIAAMKMTAQLIDCTDRMTTLPGFGEDQRERANIQATRLAGAVARMNGSFQQGMLTLQRLRSGGRQVVTVQHVHQHVQVNEGGQALVAGKVGEDGGGRCGNGGRRRK